MGVKLKRERIQFEHMKGHFMSQGVNNYAHMPYQLDRTYTAIYSGYHGNHIKIRMNFSISQRLVYVLLCIGIFRFQKCFTHFTFAIEHTVNVLQKLGYQSIQISENDPKYFRKMFMQAQLYLYVTLNTARRHVIWHSFRKLF